MLKPKFNNAETKNSALSIPRTFSCASDTFLEKKHRVCFCHIYQIQLWEMNSRSFFLAHAQDIVGITFSRSCFRSEVSLSILVKCNVNHLRAKWQGSEMEDHVQPTGLVFITMREWFLCNLKEVRVLVNALSVVKSFYFYMKFSRFIQLTKPVK